MEIQKTLQAWSTLAGRTARLQLCSACHAVLPWGSPQEPGPNGQSGGLSLELGEEGRSRGQRADWPGAPVDHFPEHPMEALHYPEGGEGQGEGEEGEKRTEALTAIAGGFQAFNRQKGGFGFRFGKNLEHPGWEDALLQLQALLGLPGAAVLPWGSPQEPGPNGQSGGLSLELGEEGRSRGQRADWPGAPVDHFPEHPMEALHYPEGGEGQGEGEEGEKRTEALTAIAGGFQAFNRQKGGFGFRFGKK
ncbi:hypothetical protein AAFF_G00333680 [Aldrovandia affinis]|uniref:Uncharacterized protein n=1 Tax=Aldrovandia affinis TaxID=143900 RepID=A0AAD7R6Q0_9TELE|nr:hypothetical protein AAFF_G00333680 [Aldrovandia affinis]